MTDTNDYFEEEEPISKSQRKREMLELQEIGKRLAALNSSQRASFNLTEDLNLALADYQRITKNEAKRRQLQYIGKLMRLNDQEAIRALFADFELEQSKGTKYHHQIEAWRDRLIKNESADVTQFMTEFPHTDVQAFRQLVRNAVKEQGTGKTPANTRKLFVFLREIITQAHQQ